METRDDYQCNYYLLDNYLNGSSVSTSDLNALRSLARCIRPLLEGYLRTRYPKYFRQNDWLGDYVALIRNATTEPYSVLKIKMVDWQDVNDYSSRYHHQNSEKEPINDAELRAYSQRAIALIET